MISSLLPSVLICVVYVIISDPRVEDWFMMSSPLPSVLICVAYVIIVKMGPTIMANQKPMDVKNIMIVYNIAMVVLSGYCFIEVSTQ